MLSNDVGGGFPSEHRDQCRDAARDRSLRDVARGLDPEHRHALGDEVLQQIAVVAPELDHPVPAGQSEP